MSKESLEAFAHQIVETFNLGLDEYMGLHAPDAVQVTAPEWPEGGTYRGLEAVREPWESIFAAQEMRGDLEEVVVLDDARVLLRARVHSRGVSSGVATTTVLHVLVTERDGLISRIEHYLEHRQALEAAGLSE